MEEVIYNYPKYQYSKFIGQDQIVVRTENEEEFERLVKYVDEFKVLPVPKEVRVSVDEFEKDHICPVHGVVMTEGVSKTKKDDKGQPLKYWSHSDRIDGKRVICFGKGWK